MPLYTMTNDSRKIRKMKHKVEIFLFILIICGFLLGTFLFYNCYSEHRDMGFSTWTSITSCSS